MASNHSLDIPEGLEPEQWQDWCIYKVPWPLRMVKPEAYTPKFVSIGPIHHGEFIQMEIWKQRYSEVFWRRVPMSYLLEGQYKGQYKNYLKVNEEKIRLSYSVKFPALLSDKFVDMMLLDTVFILELFLRNLEPEKHEGSDYLFEKLWLKDGIRQDLLLLENQVPIFTLNYLYENFSPNKREDCPAFWDLARRYFEFYDPERYSDETNQRLDWTSSKHFTDLIRHLYIPMEFGIAIQATPLPKTATTLREAGVSIEAVYGKCLLDIQFKKKRWLNWFLCLGCFCCSNCVKARLQLPQLLVDGSTELVLRNLIALEQCHYPRKHYICSYISVLYYLIHGKDDVDLLVEKGVIVHQLSSNKELATMINGLSKQVVLSSTCYGKVIKELNDHYDHCWKNFMGVIKWVYFRDPWRGSTTIIAFVLFVLTVVNYFRGFGLIHVNHGKN